MSNKKMRIFGEKLSDLAVIDEIFINCENVSGPILSRSSKSKVMGLGLWRDKQEVVETSSNDEHFWLSNYSLI